MGTFTAILIGIGIGLATSITAWLLTLAFLAPRVRIAGLDAERENRAWPEYQFKVASRRWRRALNEIEVRCNLHIPHHTLQENVLRLNVSTTSFAFVPAHWAQIITVSMDPSTLTQFGQRQLAERLDELSPKRRTSDVSSLRDIFQLIPGTRIEVTVFATDPLSGTRRASRAPLTPAASATQPQPPSP